MAKTLRELWGKLSVPFALVAAVWYFLFSGRRRSVDDYTADLNMDTAADAKDKGVADAKIDLDNKRNAPRRERLRGALRRARKRRKRSNSDN